MFSGSVKSKEEIWNDVKRLIDYGTEEEQQQAIREATEQRKASVQQNEPVSGSDEGNVFVYSFSLFGVTNTTKDREFIPAFTPNLFSDDYFDNSRFGALLSIPYSLYYSIFKGIITKKSTVLITYYF